MEEQKKKRSPVGIIFLIILALLLGGAGYLYYRIAKAPLELDDPQALAAAEPMAPADRFRVSSGDAAVQIRLETEDLWYLIVKYAGADFLDLVNAEVSPYGLTVSGCAIVMDETGLRLDLELFYKENRLVAQLPCDLEFSGRHASLTPRELKVGVIPLPVKGLLSSVKLEYDLDLPVISGVTQVSFEEDALVLTGPMEDIHALLPSQEVLHRAGVFSREMQPLVDAIGTQEGPDKITAFLEQNPGSLEQLYEKLFTLAGPEVMEQYLDSRFGLTQRFFVNMDVSAIEAEHAALTEMLNSNTIALEQFFTKAVNVYNEKRFQLTEGQFVQNRQPFQAAEFGGEEFAELFQILDPESVFLILVDVENGYVRKTSSFYRMADDKQQFTQEVDFNKTYILGCVIRGVDGDPFLLYETEVETGNTYSRKVELHPLTEEEVTALQVPGAFGVWTG